MKAALSAIALGATALAAATAYADAAAGGYQGPNAVQIATVAEVKELTDETHVKVQGFLVKALGDEKYELQDDSGTLVVEIDDEDWRGLEVGPTDRVELMGEVDKEWQTVELEADRVQLAP